MRKLLAFLALAMPAAAQQPAESPYLGLMRAAAANARAHHAPVPVLSPLDSTLPVLPLAALHQAGIQVIPWTTNDPEKMRQILRLAIQNSAITGLISDYPDRLQQVLAEERAANPGTLANFDIQGHRGGRGLRPENTLPSFESGMDQGITTIETDTGLTSDGVSLISHDQFLSPQSCRRTDGAAYSLPARVYIQDLTFQQAQQTYVCDRIHTGTPFALTQHNDLALSPVAVAFAAQEHLPSPYAPTSAEQLFRFTRFYADYYRTGPGRQHPQAAQRAHTGLTVRFNLETKLIPTGLPASLLEKLAPGVPTDLIANHTASPQAFVDALCAAIERQHMQSRATIQSFDFRTLQLVEAQHPTLQTVYLTGNPQTLSTEFLPPTLRQ